MSEETSAFVTKFSDNLVSFLYYILWFFSPVLNRASRWHPFHISFWLLVGSPYAAISTKKFCAQFYPRDQGEHYIQCWMIAKVCMYECAQATLVAAVQRAAALLLSEPSNGLDSCFCFLMLDLIIKLSYVQEYLL